MKLKIIYEEFPAVVASAIFSRHQVTSGKFSAMEVDSRVQRVLQIISERYRERLAVADFAREVNLSASRLAHLFSEHTGLSLQSYLKTTRLQKAKKLVETTPLSVKRIMYEVGYTDINHFIRAFKQIFGMSPAVYRAQYRVNQDEK